MKLTKTYFICILNFNKKIERKKKHEFAKGYPNGTDTLQGTKNGHGLVNLPYFDIVTIRGT